MNSDKVQYWKEGVSMALRNVGAIDLLTEDMIVNVAASLSLISDNQNNSLPSQNLKSPMTELLNTYEAKLLASEKRELIYRDNIANLMNVAASRIYFDGTDIKVATN